MGQRSLGLLEICPLSELCVFFPSSVFPSLDIGYIDSFIPIPMTTSSEQDCDCGSCGCGLFVALFVLSVWWWFPPDFFFFLMPSSVKSWNWKHPFSLSFVYIYIYWNDLDVQNLWFPAWNASRYTCRRTCNDPKVKWVYALQILL